MRVFHSKTKGFWLFFGSFFTFFDPFCLFFILSLNYFDNFYPRLTERLKRFKKNAKKNLEEKCKKSLPLPKLFQIYRDKNKSVGISILDSLNWNRLSTASPATDWQVLFLPANLDIFDKWTQPMFEQMFLIDIEIPN